MSGEFAFIDGLRSLVAPAGESPAGAPAVPVGIGDDCAVLDGGILLAVDTMVEGVHFRLDWCTAADVGWKALAVNVSDVAAMGAEPTACVVGLTVPAGGGHEPIARDLMAGVVDAATVLACPLVGGDTTAGGTALVVSVAIVGRLPDGADPVLRSGARPGDTVFVTGMLGLAAGALDALLVTDGTPAPPPPPPEAAARLHRPIPRTAEGTAARKAGATAMIDVSDGLAADLGHICAASRVGVTIREAALPIAPGVTAERALSGGDDYELCFTAPDPDAVRAAFAAAHLSAPTAIGTVTDAGDGRILLHPDGTVHPFPAAGFEHAL